MKNKTNIKTKPSAKKIWRTPEVIFLDHGYSIEVTKHNPLVNEATGHVTTTVHGGKNFKGNRSTVTLKSSGGEVFRYVSSFIS